MTRKVRINFAGLVMQKGFQVDTIFMLTGKRKIGSAENVETTNHKPNMSGKMCSVTGKAYLFWFPAGNLEY
jgi:hypothetical protein